MEARLREVGPGSSIKGKPSVNVSLGTGYFGGVFVCFVSGIV